MERPRHVERIPSFANEGHLYKVGERPFLVYTGTSGGGWDACLTWIDRGGWAFGQTVVTHAADRQAAVSELAAWAQAHPAGAEAAALPRGR